MPSSDITLSTTRIIVPDDVPFDTFAASDHDVRPEHPHWPLIVVTSLMQLAMGAMFAIAIAGVDRAASVTAFVAAAISLPVSLFHLGRPISAWKAIRGVRRSWLSREVVAFSAFAATSFVPVAAPNRLAAGCAACIGAIGVYCSGRLYIVRGRPAWDTPLTVISFFLTGLATGPILAMVVMGPDRALESIAVVAVVAQLGVLAAGASRLRRHPQREWRGSYRLLTQRFAPVLRYRVALAVMGGVSVIVGPAWLALVVVGTGEVIGRYLFFVTVVPLNVPGTFSRPGGAR
jgi:formate dehydrogenase iron-sulfur subunit